jgi:hypothetical protein
MILFPTWNIEKEPRININPKNTYFGFLHG